MLIMKRLIATGPMRHFCIIGLATLLLSTWCGGAAHAELAGSGAPHIEWEVKNRFRLFRNEADFQRHVAAAQGDGVLAAERRLASETDGRGWARDVVERLCVDRAGKLLEVCERDGAREIYLAPRDHRVGVVLAGTLPANEGCVWTFDDGDGPARQVNATCNEEVKAHLLYGRPTTVERRYRFAGRHGAAAGQRHPGARRPDRRHGRFHRGGRRQSRSGRCGCPTKGSASSVLTGVEYYRPGRAGFSGNKSCNTMAGDDAGARDWARQSARWLSGPCHRSLYSYQMRTALELAVENKHIAVTFIPLGCSGATINAGFLNSQRARECPSPGTGAACSGTARAQIAELTELLATARRYRADRNLDLVLLTIGANDILFSGLIANVIIEPGTERSLLSSGGIIASVQDAAEGSRSRAARQLRQGCAPRSSRSSAEICRASST